MASYMEAGEDWTSRNEEMTNHYKSTEAASLMSEAARNSYPGPSTRNYRPGSWHPFNFANPPTS